MFNLWYDLFPSSRFHPYFGGGVGADRFKLNRQPTNQLTAGDPVHSCTQSLMLSLNCFFDKPVAPPPSAEPAPVVVLPICSDTLDNDGDEADPAICSDGKDNDGDGLIDFPSHKGCTAAGDTDEIDPCKTPAPGERISLKGCGLGDVIVLRGVKFEFDDARLTANAKTILDNVGEELIAYPEIEVELSGHTDAKGPDEYNQALSDKRAAAVKRYLVGKAFPNHA